MGDVGAVLSVESQWVGCDTWGFTATEGARLITSEMRGSRFLALAIFDRIRSIG